jgi:hypothetical protein
MTQDFLGKPRSGGTWGCPGMGETVRHALGDMGPEICLGISGYLSRPLGCFQGCVRRHLVDGRTPREFPQWPPVPP